MGFSLHISEICEEKTVVKNKEMSISYPMTHLSAPSHIQKEHQTCLAGTYHSEKLAQKNDGKYLQFFFLLY